MGCRYRGQLILSVPPSAVLDFFHRSPVIDRFRVRGVDSTGWRVYLGRGMNLWSWGERITVCIMDNQDGNTLLDIESEAAMPLQFIDWGVNRANVDRLSDILRRTFPWQGPPPVRTQPPVRNQ